MRNASKCPAWACFDLSACLSKLDFQVKGGAYTEQTFDYQSFHPVTVSVYIPRELLLLLTSTSHFTGPNIIQNPLGLSPQCRF